MRERLIKTINKAREKCGTSTNCKKCSGYGKGSGCISALIADFLLADGWMRLLHRVGDTVYAVDRRTALWWRGRVDDFFLLSLDDIKVIVRFEDGDIATYDVDDVFLTREEAEAALRKEGVTE